MKYFKFFFDCILFRRYLALLRRWFKCGLSKLEFDTEARKILLKETIGYHNRFLVALFTRCQQLADQNCASEPEWPLSAMRTLTNSQDETTSNDHSAHNSPDMLSVVSDDGDARIKPMIKKAKFNLQKSTPVGKFTRVYDEARLLTIEPRDLPSTRQWKRMANLRNDSKLQFCSTERTLPDHFMSNLRLFVNVWEFGIEGISDEAILITNLAIRDFIKNLITSAILFKSHRQSAKNGQLCLSNAQSNSNHFLFNAQPLIQCPAHVHPITLDEQDDHFSRLLSNRHLVAHEKLLSLACAPQVVDRANPNKSRIRLPHLYHALKTYRTSIPIHSIYSINMERIQLRLYENESADDNRTENLLQMRL